MTAPLSLDLRRRLARAAERGASIRGAPRHVEVSSSAAIGVMDRLRTGSLEPGRIGGHRKPALADHADLIRALVEAAGASLMYLPAYSPDLNPIEMAFAGLEALLPNAAERTVDDLRDRVAILLDAFAPDECASSFKAAGHDPV